MIHEKKRKVKPCLTEMIREKKRKKAKKKKKKREKRERPKKKRKKRKKQKKVFFYRLVLEKREKTKKSIIAWY